MPEKPTWTQQVKERGQLAPGSKLLLPMHMDVLVVGEGYKGMKWKSTALRLLKLKNAKTSHASLGKFLDQPVTEGIEDDPAHDPGIHLHWILPRTFRHGVQREQDGVPDFPLVPNRWLVIRTSVVNNKTRVKSWIVESDYTVRGSAADPNWILLNRKEHSDRLAPVTSSYEAVQIGKQFDVDKWKDETIQPLFLTIMSPGDPGFAASYTSCKGVFGFYDAMVDKGNAEPDGLYSYMVTGWYSDAAEDILHGVANVDEWLKRMEEYSLSLELPDDNKGRIMLPDGVFCHATVFSVEWKGADRPYVNKQVPDAKFIATSIGLSPLDALAPAILKNIPSVKTGELESFLAIFQYKMLSGYDSASGREVLKQQVHTQSFNTVQAGSLWVIERKEIPEAGRQKPGALPLLPESIAGPLRELNALQNEYDEKINELHSLQSQLYAYWFKYALSSNRDALPPKERDRADTIRKKLEELCSRRSGSSPLLARIGKLKERLPELKRRKPVVQAQENNNENADPIDKYEGLINEKYTALTKDILSPIRDGTLANLTVKETKLPPFYLPKDPSVVVSGVSPSVKYRDTGPLTGRLINQLVSTIFFQRETVPRRVIIPAADLVKESGAAFPANTHIPATIEMLFNEMQLLDPSQAPAGAAVVYYKEGIPADEDKKKQLADELAAFVRHPDAGRLRNQAGLTPVVPPDFSLSSWKQPWTPLVMEWALEWHPSYNNLSDEEVLRNWAFGNQHDGIYNNIDFVFKQAKPAARFVKYSGRIPLTADLGKKIDTVFSKDLSFLYGEGLKKLDPLSQELSGLNNNLIMRENSTQLPPLDYDEVIKKLIVDPLISDIDDQYTWNPMMEENNFFPFRGGHLKITALRVIDSFGQVMEMPRGEFSVSQSLPVIRDGASTFIELPLRLAQPARLRFRWMAADKSGRETSGDPATSPVCGWLLPNRLDQSLMVFDGAGKAVGALRTTGPGGTISWVNAPGGKGHADMKEAVLNEYAAGVLNGLLDTGSDTVLDHLIREIDELQKRAAAKTARQSITMALPIGYPVAIVKASCRLELKDLPAHYQGWDPDNYDARMFKVNFPVVIGDVRSKTDGLAGYFIQGEYKTLRLPYAYDRTPAHEYFASNTKITVNLGQKATDLILLIDPRMGVHINCGILPAGYYELPDQLINQAIEAIQPSFLASPLLGSETNLQLPLAALPDKVWQWITAAKEKATGWNDAETLDRMVKGGLSFEPLHIKEGWLTLVNPPQSTEKKA